MKEDGNEMNSNYNFIFKGMVPFGCQRLIVNESCD